MSATITVEEAVAAMISMDYIPEGLTATDMTAAFLEEAEVEFESAKIDKLPNDEIQKLEDRFDACDARHALALLLKEDLQWQVANPEASQIKTKVSNLSEEPRLDLESLKDWAYEKYGICIPDQLKAEKIRWDDITIKIYADWKIGYFLGRNEYTKSSFQDIGLMGKRKHEPSQLGGILLGLSLGRKFPKGKNPEGREKKAVSDLRNALKKLTKLSSDPFYPCNEADGWKPRFKLIDDRKNADERAKKEAKRQARKGTKPDGFDDTRDYSSTGIDDDLEGFDSTRDYDYEDNDGQIDGAGRWLKENGR